MAIPKRPWMLLLAVWTVSCSGSLFQAAVPRPAEVVLVPSDHPEGSIQTSASPSNPPTPIVMWHGMGDSCCNPFSMGAIKGILEKHIPGVYVVSLMIGSSVLEDTRNGFFMPVQQQIQMVCDQIAGDQKLSQGYNAIGFSQGGQFLRAVAQKCPNHMKTLITFGAQHQGIYGLPKCLGENHVICDYVRRLLNYGAYLRWIQEMSVQAQYWHDPLHEDVYQAKSLFLADLNRPNAQYAKNLNSLDKLVLVQFDSDTVVDPKGTEWFDFYVPGQAVEMQPMRNSSLYLEDHIGLRSLDQQGKLDLVSVKGDHLTIHEDVFVQQFINKYLI